ncbi:MAG: ribosomal protein S18-alanine N-acetyltransferase [Pyrodictiaceae archaeon]
MGIVIRSATLKDLKRVYAIELASFTNPYPEWYFTLLLGVAGELFTVAEYDGEIVGYSVAVLRTGGVCHLVSIAVDPRYRGRGIGARLLQDTEDRCKRIGARSIILEVSHKNLVAYMLYSSRGYEPLRFIKDYYGKGDHAILLLKIFKPNRNIG